MLKHEGIRIIRKNACHTRNVDGGVSGSGVTQPHFNIRKSTLINGIEPQHKYNNMGGMSIPIIIVNSTTARGNSESREKGGGQHFPGIIPPNSFANIAA